MCFYDNLVGICHMKPVAAAAAAEAEAEAEAAAE